jgi:hypothetical protein
MAEAATRTFAPAAAQRGGLRRYAAVHLDLDAQAGFVNEPPQSRDLRQPLSMKRWPEAPGFTAITTT